MTRLQAEALKYAVKRVDPGQHTLTFFGIVGDTGGELQCVCIHRGTMVNLTWAYLQEYCEDRVRSTRVRAQRVVTQRRSNDDKMARVINPAGGSGPAGTGYGLRGPSQAGQSHHGQDA